MQIQNTGSMIEACLVISREHHDELVEAFEARFKFLMKEADWLASKEGMTYDEASQEYWTSEERKRALRPSTIKALDDVVTCRGARDSLLRVVQAKGDSEL